VAEARVEHAFARRPGTLVVVAHRVSSALRARRVLVMDGTRAVAGTHERLLAESALYRDLVGHWRGAADEGEVAGAGTSPPPRPSRGLTKGGTTQRRHDG